MEGILGMSLKDIPAGRMREFGSADYQRFETRYGIDRKGLAETFYRGTYDYFINRNATFVVLAVREGRIRTIYMRFEHPSGEEMAGFRRALGAYIGQKYGQTADMRSHGLRKVAVWKQTFGTVTVEMELSQTTVEYASAKRSSKKPSLLSKLFS